MRRRRGARLVSAREASDESARVGREDARVGRRTKANEVNECIALWK